MARAHFTVGDVEALIPALERIFIDVLQIRAGLRGIETQLERANVRMSREELLESDDGPPEVRRAKAVFRGFYEALSDEIERVRALGGEVKDVETGLVDFPGLRRRRGDPALLAPRREEDRLLAPASTAASPSRRPSTTTWRRAPQPAGLRRRPPCPASRAAARRGRGAAARRGARSRRDPDLGETPAPGRAAVAGGVPRRLRHGSGRRSSAIPWWARPIPTWSSSAGCASTRCARTTCSPTAAWPTSPTCPHGKLVGFGRLAELVDCFTKRLTLQERATHQIADALCRHLGARGAGCVIEAEQLCLALPGEKHDQSGVVTSAFVGEMRERPDLKARLLEAANLGGRAR